MKALNRAIARTTGDITKLCAFHIDQLGTQGCAVKQTPETLKQLEQHLAALLEMERKQLELSGMKEATLTGDGTGEALPGILVHGGGVRACHGTSYVVGGMGGGGGGSGNSGTMISGTNGRGAGAGTGSTIAFSTPQEKNGSLLDSFIANGMMEQDGFREHAVPPAPDVINMNDPANWLPGDRLLRKIVHGNFPHFTSGREYTVTSNGPDVLKIMGNAGVEVSYPHKPFCEPASNFFTWLRHGEAQQ